MWAVSDPRSLPSTPPLAGQRQQQLLVTAAVILGWVAVQAVGGSVNVSSSSELLAALQTQHADQIVLQNDVAVGLEFDQFKRTPLQITRNITVTSAVGNSSIDAMPRLDMQSRIGIMQLCSSCTFSLMWVSTANENPLGTGGAMTVFWGQPGSRVDMLGGVGWRPACPPIPGAQLSVVKLTQRSIHFPSPPGGQLIELVNLTYRGKSYADALKTIDLSSDVAPQQLISRSEALTGGYGIRRRGVVRVCEHDVSAACLAQRSPEDCLAEELPGVANSVVNSTGPRRNMVAIAVPVALAGLLVLLAAAALIIWRQRQHKKRRHHSLLPPAAAPTHCGAGAGLLTADLDADVQAAADQGLQGGGGRSAPTKQPSNSSLVQQSFSANERWQLIWSSSAASTDRPTWNPQDTIELGVLLGAGSFARVYKGKWSGLDVAVKVIHHSRDTISTVATEVQLMLSLNHPNIVRAYHCITKQIVTAQQQSPAAPPAQLRIATTQRGGEQRVPVITQGDTLVAVPGSIPEDSVSGIDTPQQQPHPLLQQQRERSAGVAPFPSWGSGSTSTGQTGSRGLQQQQQQLHTAVQSRAFREVEMVATQEGNSHTTAGSAFSPVQPSTPPNLTGAAPCISHSVAAASSSAAGTGTGTGTGTGAQSLVRAGFTSSSGVSSFVVQDLVAGSTLPASQRTVSRFQRLSLGAVSAAGGAQGVVGGASSAQIGLHPTAATAPMQQPPPPADSVSFVGSIGPSFGVISLPQTAAASPEQPSAAAAVGASGLALLSCSTASTASTDSLKVPRSMSTLQGSAGPTSLIGSLEGSRAWGSAGPTSLIGSLEGSRAWGSAGSLPYPGAAVSASAATTMQQFTLHRWQQQPSSGSSLTPAAVTGGGLEASFATGRGRNISSSQGGDLMSTFPLWSHAASAGASGPLLGAAPGMPGSQGLAAGDNYPVLPGARSTAASGSGPSMLGSSSGPSRGSFGSQAWPLIISPEDSVSQLPGGVSLAGRDIISSAVGASSRGGESWQGAPDPAQLCETWLVTELCDRGTLARQASELQPESSEQDMLCLLHLLRDVACGLKLLKSQSIVHADLNAHNVLVSSSSVARHGLVAKVADLGLSRILKQQATHRTTRTVGMLTHQPPELLRDGRMSPAVDIYSFGIMMCEVFTRQAAYARMRYGQIFQQVVVLGVRPAVPPDMPEDYELLMRRCWSADTRERPSVDMLLECLELMIEDRQEHARSVAAS